MASFPYFFQISRPTARRLLVLVYFTFDFFTFGKKTNGNILNESSMPAFAGSSVAMPAALERKNRFSSRHRSFCQSKERRWRRTFVRETSSWAGLVAEISTKDCRPAPQTWYLCNQSSSGAGFNFQSTSPTMLFRMTKTPMPASEAVLPLQCSRHLPSNIDSSRQDEPSHKCRIRRRSGWLIWGKNKPGSGNKTAGLFAVVLIFHNKPVQEVVFA